MKWLVSTIVSGLVLLIGFSFARAQRATALAEQADADAQVVAALAAQTEGNSNPDDTLGAPDESATKSDQPAASDDAAQPAVEKPDDPARPASSDALPGSSDTGPQPAAAELPTPKADSRTNGPGNALLYHVRHHDAASLAELIKRMHPQGDKMYADPRNNVLIFPDGIEPKFLDILQELDQPAPKKTFDSSADMAFPLNRLPIAGRMFDPNSASPDTTNSPVAQEYRQLDAQAAALANAYRQQLAASPQDANRLEQLKSDLKAAVHAAFHARQTWQRSQAAQLRTRLEQIERRISDRGQSADEIIQRRVDDLLHPEKQWEQDNNSAAAVPARSRPRQVQGWMSQNFPQVQAPLAGVTETADGYVSNAAARPAAQPPIGGTGSRLGSPESQASGIALDYSLPEQAGSARKDLLDAEAAVASARAAVAELTTVLERSETYLKRSQDLLRKGAMSERGVRDAETEVTAAKTVLARAERELQIKQRNLDHASEMVALQSKLREADLADSKLRLQHADDELKRADALHKRGALSKEEYDAKQLAQQLAASQQERAKMLLDLYRKALPDQIPFVEKTDPGAQPGASNIGSPAVDPSTRPALDATSDTGGDPRRRALDAAHAVTSARAALKEAQALVANSEQSLKPLQDAEANVRGTVARKTILDAEHEVRRSQAAAQKLAVDLQVKERQLEDAQETLAAQIKLREIDVADAKLRLEEAEAKFSRASQLFENKAIAKEQFEEIRVAQRLAESQYQRAQLLLELYRKALPDQQGSTDKDREEKKKTSNKTSDASSSNGATIGGAGDADTTEVPIGDFSFSNATAAPGMIIHVDFRLSVVAASKQAPSLDSQLKQDQARVRQAVNKIVRISSLEELNDPNLAVIKRLIREDINRLLRKSEVLEVVITNVRTMEQ